MVGTEVLEEFDGLPRAVQRLLPLARIWIAQTIRDGDRVKPALGQLGMELCLRHSPSFQNSRKASESDSDEARVLHIVQDLGVGRFCLIPNIGGDTPFDIFVCWLGVSSGP